MKQKILAGTLATLVMLSATLIPSAAKAPMVTEPKDMGIPAITSDAPEGAVRIMDSAENGQVHRYTFLYDLPNQTVTVKSDLRGDPLPVGGARPYDGYVDEADAFVDLSTLYAHPELGYLYGQGGFPNEMAFAYSDLITSGQIRTMTVHEKKTYTDEVITYRFTAENGQLKKYTRTYVWDEDEPAQVWTAVFRYNADGALKRITLTSETGSLMAEYQFVYRLDRQLSLIRIYESFDDSYTYFQYMYKLDNTLDRIYRNGAYNGTASAILYPMRNKQGETVGVRIINGNGTKPTYDPYIENGLDDYQLKWWEDSIGHLGTAKNVNIYAENTINYYRTTYTP